MPFLPPNQQRQSTEGSEGSLDLNEWKDDGIWRRQLHQLDYIQIICTSLQTDNNTSTSPVNFTGRMLFMAPNQQCQSTEGKQKYCYTIL